MLDTEIRIGLKEAVVISSEQDIVKPYLDKIRAEIEQTSKTVDGFLMHDETKRTILQILDKYE